IAEVGATGEGIGKLAAAAQTRPRRTGEEPYAGLATAVVAVKAADRRGRRVGRGRRPADGEPRTGMGVEVALADRRHRAAGGEHHRPAGLAGRRPCSEGVGEVDPGALERGARAAETALVDLHGGEVAVGA